MNGSKSIGMVLLLKFAPWKKHINDGSRHKALGAGKMVDILVGVGLCACPG
ncbi:MAG: hypothetical protein JW927_19475 [Deltaproteobacteria bacterium]|nr:hypothetical protein [Deltaproteobacteria bacterium]